MKCAGGFDSARGASDGKSPATLRSGTPFIEGANSPRGSYATFFFIDSPTTFTVPAALSVTAKTE
jgi:hypothetical protein